MNNNTDSPFFYPPEVAAPLPLELSEYLGGDSGKIMLFRDDNWGEKELNPLYEIDIHSSEFPDGAIFSFSGTELQDSATWIAFNLPEGVVCTLFDSIPTNDNPYDLSDAGATVDLIGNSRVQTIDLTKYGAGDCLSGGVWRKVNANRGWFQLFQNENCSGVFATIFLSEWGESEPELPQDSKIKNIHSISDWWFQDGSQSINYSGLTPTQRLVLTDNADGSGLSKTLRAENPHPLPQEGQPYKLATCDLNMSSMGSRVSAFRFYAVKPIRYRVESKSYDGSDLGIGPGQKIEGTVTLNNKTPIDGGVYITKVAQGRKETMENTVSTEFDIGGGLEIGAQISATDGVVTGTRSYSVNFNVSDKKESKKTNMNQQDFDLEDTIKLPIAPETKTIAHWWSATDKATEFTVTQKGKFYYEEYLPGSIPQKDGTHLLHCPITVVFDGVIAETVQVEFTKS